MSFEGYYRKLCENGHLWEEDVDSLEEAYCPICGKGMVWRETIDMTNGIEDANKPTVLKQMRVDKLSHTDDYGNHYFTRLPIYEIPTKIIKIETRDVVGYKVIQPFDDYIVGTIFKFTDVDGITSYVSAPDKDSSLIPEWLCAAMSEYFDPVYEDPEAKGKPEDALEDCYLTVGQLKKFLKDLPDDGKIYYQRIEDVYFEKHNWGQNSKFMGSIENLGLSKEEYIKVWSPVKYPNDNNLYLTAHY